ncbi:hypothetical protein EMCRGX_G034324 [Ephydatia muelleri]
MQDSECDQVESLNAFLSEVLRSNVTKVGLIGSGCSVATESVGFSFGLTINLPFQAKAPTQDLLTEWHAILERTSIELTTALIRHYGKTHATMEVTQYTYVSALTYDAVWTLALALNASMHLIKTENDSGCKSESGSLEAWENFTYSNSKMGWILKRTLQQVKFYGISGLRGLVRVFMNERGWRDEMFVLQDKCTGSILSKSTLSQVRQVLKHRTVEERGEALQSKLKFPMSERCPIKSKFYQRVCRKCKLYMHMNTSYCTVPVW